MSDTGQHAESWMQQWPKCLTYAGMLLMLNAFIEHYSPLSSREQTHCALVAHDSKWVAVAFYSAFLNFHQCGVLTVLFACYMAAAISARSVYTIHPHTMSHHFMQSHIRRTHACLAVTCHLHFWQNDQDFFHATAVIQVGMYTEIRVSTESWPWRRKLSCRSSWDSNPWPFNHESGTLTTDLPLVPECNRT